MVELRVDGDDFTPRDYTELHPKPSDFIERYESQLVQG